MNKEESNKKGKTFLIIDGNSFIYRAFHFANSQQMESAVPIFSNMINSIFFQINPSYAVICFDSKEKTFRHEAYDKYKGKRKPVDDQEMLTECFEGSKIFLDSINAKYINMVRYEADDLIASIAKIASKEEMHSTIVSGDRDMMQLVKDPYVKFLFSPNAANIALLNEGGVLGKFGIPPEQYLQYAAIKGDSSDNLPGVRGFGPKKTQKLINSFGTVEKAYEHLDNKKDIGFTVKDKNALNQYKENAFRNLELMKLIDDLDVGVVEDYYYSSPQKKVEPTSEKVEKPKYTQRTLFD